ncbi:hypothetical protein KQX54_004538 [Cotesia glomerata]|uniref:Uncharacterized protein n=1 Tax=Cotesia glomerata TaxID=32391 RepID=A0AAV7I098_COTGL|nr:hypothetical protein KQX54_004538 [Cotesia glomerata]
MQQTEIGRERRPDSETRDRVRIKQEIIDAEVKVKVKQEVQVKQEEENNTNYENGFAVDQDLERKTGGNFGRNCPAMHPAYRAVGGPGPPNSFGFPHFFPPNAFGIPNFMDPQSQHSEQEKIHFSKNFLHPRQEKMKDLEYRNYEQKFDMYHFRTPPEFSQLIQQQHSFGKELKLKPEGKSMQSFSVILHLHLSPSRSCMGTKTLSVELNRYVVIRGRTISRYCVIYSEKWFHCEIMSSAYIEEVSI